jgi:hypothetical protein
MSINLRGSKAGGGRGGEGGAQTGLAEDKTGYLTLYFNFYLPFVFSK